MLTKRKIKVLFLLLVLLSLLISFQSDLSKDNLSKELNRNDSYYLSNKTEAIFSTTTDESLVNLMKQFGQKSKENLATDEKYWKHWCKVTHPDALDAIKRAKTNKCKRELSSISCLTKTNLAFPDYIPR